MRRLRHFFSRWQNWIAFLAILGFIYTAVAAPQISPDDPKRPGPFLRVGKATEGRPLPPDEKAPLGMLPHGQDVFHPLVWGARGALQFGLIVTFFTAIFGILYGALAGLIGGRSGGWMMNIADSFLAIPVIAGVVFLQQLWTTTITAMGGLYYTNQFGPVIEIVGPMTPIIWLFERFNPLMISLIFLSWMPYARIVHSIVILLVRSDFIQAARALGGSPWWVIRKHLIPNSLAPALVLAARDVGGVVLLQATFTFVGIGGDSIWGSMLAQGRNWVIGPGGSVLSYWWVFLPPTIAVMLFGVAWNMLGDGLSDALDPQSA
ncbi:MAG: putative D,D-dipeptide transport system permease protein DdpC [Anaerolineales bacterium]|nr:putative D,D-dipeptide transport system permease protein DdpC [Anaerolineales bacterium]